jgi:phage-related protein
MEKLTFISSTGYTITFDATLPVLLGEVSGIGEIPIDIQTADAHGIDGKIYYESTAAPRLIKFDFWISADTHEGLHAARREMQKCLNPKAGEGLLMYEDDNSKYIIAAAVCDGPVILSSKPNDKMALYQHVEVAFCCNQPMWQSFIEYSTVIVGLTGGLQFPLSFPINFATTADNMVINNDGDTKTPLRIEFRGPATGCRITKIGTGEYVDVTYTLLTGEKLIIDTDPVQISVSFVDASGVVTSAFNKINPLSTFFQLTTGINTISFTTATGSPEVYLYWRIRYAGV